MGVTKADVTPRPFPGNTAQPQAANGQAARGAGKSALLQVCSECHDVDQAVSMRLSEKDWRT